MATGLHSDAVIRDALFEAGFIEGVGQNTNAFNEASNGAIRLVSQMERGFYSKRRFFDTLSSIISRRDLTSVAAGTGVKPTMDEIISVKLFRNAGPVDYTEGLFRTMAGMDLDEFSFELGGEVARYAVKDYLNSAVIAATAALSQETSTLVHDATDGNLAFTDLNTGFGKMGDAQMNFAALLMHSKHLNDLIADGLANYVVENVAGSMIVTGAVQAMGRPIIVTDSPALVVTDGVTSGEDAYVALGLMPGAIVVTESEELSVAQYFLDRQQITRRFHGEHAFNVEIKGYKWDTGNGGNNPTDANLGTSDYWDAVVADKRDKAGVYIKSS